MEATQEDLILTWTWGGFDKAPSGPKREKLFLQHYVFGHIPHQTGTHIPHLLGRESYHLGSHFGTILGSLEGGLGVFKMVFLVILGLLKSAKNSPTLSLRGV